MDETLKSGEKRNSVEACRILSDFELLQNEFCHTCQTKLDGHYQCLCGYRFCTEACMNTHTCQTKAVKRFYVRCECTPYKIHYRFNVDIYEYTSKQRELVIICRKCERVFNRFFLQKIG